MNRIVVGVDESACAGVALRWAADEAERHGAQLTAALAWGYLDQHRPEPDAEFDPDYDEAAAQAALDEIVARTLGDRAGSVTTQVVNDLAAPALLAASEGADLLVVGARGLGAVRGALLGSVSQHCLQHARCPVAVIREDGHETSANRVVVGVDGSEISVRALRWAVAEARARQARLDLVSAFLPPYLGGFPFDVAAIDVEAVEQAAGEVMDIALAEVDTEGVEVGRLAVPGSPSRALLDEAENADVLVVGSRGRGGFKGLLLGSVSQQVAQHSPCPVVVVPHDR